MMAQCTARAQLKSVYGVMCHHEPGPPISMSKVRPGVEARHVHCDLGSKVFFKMTYLGSAA